MYQSEMNFSETKTKCDGKVKANMTVNLSFPNQVSYQVDILSTIIISHLSCILRSFTTHIEEVLDLVIYKDVKGH